MRLVVKTKNNRDDKELGEMIRRVSKTPVKSFYIFSWNFLPDSSEMKNSREQSIQRETMSVLMSI